MALVLQDLITEVRDHLGGRTDVTDSRIVRSLNIAQEYIARNHAYEDLYRVLSGQTLIANDKFLEFAELPSGFREPMEIWSFRLVPGDGRARKLIFRSTRAFDRLVPEPEFYDADIPTHYTVWNDKFELWRVPDVAYSYELRMAVWPTAFTTSQLQATSIFDRKDDMIIALSVSWIFGQLGEYERAARFFNIFRAREVTAIQEDQALPDQDIISDRGKARPEAVLGRPWADPFVRYVR